MRRFAFLLVAFAALLAHADESETLVNRLSIEGVDQGLVGVYSRYASGRPRLVVAATNLSLSEGEALLIRLPDADQGKGKVVDRYDLRSGAQSVTFVRLIDPKDVVVETSAEHYVVGTVYRVRGEHLVEIADDYADDTNTPDLDGDGIPEIVVPGYGSVSPCGERATGAVLRWSGSYFVPDGRKFAFVRRGTVGELLNNDEFHIPATDAQPHPGHYRLRVHGDHGAKSVQVLIDDEIIVPDTLITLEEDCHTIDVKVTGPPGATAWAFLEERP